MLTIIGNIGYLEATSTVGLARLKVDPELPGAGREGNGPLIGLAGLIGGNGGWGGWEARSRSGEQQGRLLKPSCRRAVGGRSHADRGSPLCMHPPPTLQHTHILSHHPLLAPQLLFDVRVLTECKKFDI